MPSEKEKAKKDSYQKALAAFELAMKAFHKGDYQKAFDSLTAFLEKHNSENELVDRAKLYLKICERHVKATRISLKTFDDYYETGTLKANEGEYDEALKMLNKAQTLEPKEGKVFYLISSIYCLMDQTDKCLENLKQAVTLDQSFAILAQNEAEFDSIKEDEKFIAITRAE